MLYSRRDRARFGGCSIRNARNSLRVHRWMDDRSLDRCTAVVFRIDRMIPPYRIAARLVPARARAGEEVQRVKKYSRLLSFDARSRRR